jgi:hypothetical protein
MQRLDVWGVACYRPGHKVDEHLRHHLSKNSLLCVRGVGAIPLRASHICSVTASTHTKPTQHSFMVGG